MYVCVWPIYPCIYLLAPRLSVSLCLCTVPTCQALILAHLHIRLLEEGHGRAIAHRKEQVKDVRLPAIARETGHTQTTLTPARRSAQRERSGAGAVA